VNEAVALAVAAHPHCEALRASLVGNFVERQLQLMRDGKVTACDIPTVCFIVTGDGGDSACSDFGDDTAFDCIMSRAAVLQGGPQSLAQSARMLQYKVRLHVWPWRSTSTEPDAPLTAAEYLCLCAQYQNTRDEPLTPDEYLERHVLSRALWAGHKDRVDSASKPAQVQEFLRLAHVPKRAYIRPIPLLSVS